MNNILTVFLIISTLLTGIFWFYYHIRNMKAYFIKKKNIYNPEKKHFFQSFASFFPIFLIVLIVRSFIYEPFQIPSGSMMPTLLIGDFILVEKFSYGIREPITNKTIINFHHPKRGDIVVFKHPINSLNYIKRVIGLPGDQITYDVKSKQITICKNYIMHHQCHKRLPINYSKMHISNFIQKIYFSNKNTSKHEKKIYNSLYFNIAQENINGFKHDILLLHGIKNREKYYQQKSTSKLIWIVPKNQYFMMGDNRDNSLDSRYWGFVPERNLIGKAVKIWMSFDKNQYGWPIGIRLSRIGSIY